MRTSDSSQAITAYDRIIAPHRSAIRAYARTLLREPEDAEDAAQEALVLAHRKLEDLRDEASALPWLLTITRRCCQELSERGDVQSRRAANVADLAPLSDLAAPSAEDRLVEFADDGPTYAALAALPVQYRLPMAMKYVHGCGYDEIGAYLGLDHTQVAERLRTGRRKLLGADPTPAARATCANVVDLLCGYLEGGLLLGPATEVRDHLSVCTECEGRLASLAGKTVVGPSRLGQWAEALRLEPTEATVLALRADVRQVGQAALDRGRELAAARIRRQPTDLGWLLVRGALGLEGAGGRGAERDVEAIAETHPSKAAAWTLLLEALPEHGAAGQRLRERLIASGAAGPEGCGPEPAAKALALESLAASRCRAARASSTLADEALRLDAASCFPWLARAAAHAARGETDAALAASLTALRASAGHGGLWLRILGEVLLPLREVVPWRLVRHAEVTAARSPGRSASWSGLAAAAASVGQTERALQCLLRASEMGARLSEEDVSWLSRAAEHVARGLGGDPRVEEVAGHLAALGALRSETAAREARNCAFYVVGRAALRVERGDLALRALRRVRSEPLSEEVVWLKADADALAHQLGWSDSRTTDAESAFWRTAPL